MSHLPHEIYTAEQTRDLERIVIEQHFISAATLMSRAGHAALNVIKERWPHAERILVICGSGNNGGDGFELARQALAENYQVNVVQVGDEKNMSEHTFAARKAVISTGTSIESLTETLPSTDIIVDALLGIGINREVSGDYALAINAINHFSKRIPILSLDVPSGIHANTGNVLGQAVQANTTISFLGLNKGLFVGEGPNYVGKIFFDSLNVPPAAYKLVQPIARRVSLAADAAGLAPRQRTGHKGLYGHLFIIGGDHGMSGAVRMAGEAGSRVGAGLISLVTRASHAPYLNLSRPELMCHGLEDTHNLVSLLQPANALALGPGLGQNAWGMQLFEKALETHLPLVIDADALNFLSQNPQYRDHWILTPHPGEAGRLLGCSSKDIQADRFAAVEELQKRYGGVIVLKGAGTLISNGEKPIALSNWGNPGMGSGGMGDVLTGVIGGLLAQHFTLMEAACVGVTLHGMAADKAVEVEGERGTLAMDLMPHLRRLANPTYP